MIPYILYAAIILTACFIFYKLLLHKETFFHLNRLVLLTCMMLAFVLPLVHVPQQYSFREVPLSASTALTTVTVNSENSIEGKENISTADNKLTQKTAPTINLDQVMHWLIYLYWFGVAIFTLNFLMQASLLLHKAYSRPSIRDGKFRIVETTGDKAPCSFGNNIFINPAKYDWETYNQVLLHEKIHIDQKHTLDLLLAEIVLIFQWFNPFAWLWRKELESNLEFYTDSKLLLHDSVQKQSYQLSLLKVAAPHYPLSLTTNYNQSLLKKRLLMMNAKKSNVHTIWKYFFLLPLMILFVCLFNEPVVKSQSADVKAKVKSQPKVNTRIKTEGNWFATIKEDKINIQFKSDDEKYDGSSNGSTFILNEFKDLPMGKEGAFALTREAGTMNFTGKFEGDKGMGRYKFTPDKSYTNDMEKEGVNINDDDGEMVFFFINVKRSYVQMLKANGYTNLDKDKIIPLAALDVSDEYIKSIKQAGFTNIGLDNLVPFKALGIDKAYIDEIRKAGYKDVSPDKIITLKAQGIDGKYIADFRSSVKNERAELPERIEKKELHEQDENDDKDQYSKNIEKTKNKNKSNNDINDSDDDLIAFKALNIDNTFINSFKEVGYNNLSNSDLISMKALGVTPEYATSFRNAGYTNLKADQLVSLKAQDVTLSLIKQYKDLGFDNINLDDVIGAKATGTSPTFIKNMRDKGHNMKSLDKYIALKSVLGE
ncbi:MAG: M56 family metallopeptidase [Ginsengibacter sp.]